MCYYNHLVGKRREKTEFGLLSSKQAQHNSYGRSLQLNVMIDSLSISHHFTHNDFRLSAEDGRQNDYSIEVHHL